MINKKRLITATGLLIGAVGWGSYRYYDSNKIVVDVQPQAELVSENVAQQISTFEQQERPRIVSATLLDIISTPEGRESRRNLLINEVRQLVETFMSENGYNWFTLSFDKIPEDQKQTLNENRRLLLSLVTTHCNSFLTEEITAIKNYINPVLDDALANIPTSLSRLSKEELQTTRQYLQARLNEINSYFKATGTGHVVDNIWRESRFGSNSGQKIISDEDVKLLIVDYIVSKYNFNEQQVNSINSAGTLQEKSELISRFINENADSATLQICQEFIRRFNLQIEPKTSGDIFGWMMWAYREMVLTPRLSTLEEGSYERDELQNLISQLKDFSYNQRMNILRTLEPDFMTYAEELRKTHSRSRPSVSNYFGWFSAYSIENLVRQQMGQSFETFKNSFEQEKLKYQSISTAILRITEEIGRR